MARSNNVYRLNGLRVAFFGFLLEILAGPLGQLIARFQTYMAEDNMASIISGGISLLSLILIISGLSSAASASRRFRKARNYYILGFILTAGMIGVILFTLFRISPLMEQQTPENIDQVLNKLLICGLILCVLLLLNTLFQVLKYRNMMFGCAEIAQANGDQKLAKKSKWSYRWYLISSLLLIVLAGVILYLQKDRLETLESIDELKDPNLLLNGPGLIAFALLVLDLVLVFISYIRILHKLLKIPALYNKVPIPGRPQESASPVPEKPYPEYTHTETAYPGAPAAFPAAAAAAAPAPAPVQPAPEISPAPSLPKEDQGPDSFWSPSQQPMSDTMSILPEEISDVEE